MPIAVDEIFARDIPLEGDAARFILLKAKEVWPGVRAYTGPGNTYTPRAKRIPLEFLALRDQSTLQSVELFGWTSTPCFAISVNPRSIVLETPPSALEIRRLLIGLPLWGRIVSLGETNRFRSTPEIAVEP